MKKVVFAIWLVASMVHAQMIVLEGIDVATVTTGDILDGTRSLVTTTNVLEIAGLSLSVRSGASSQQINVTSGSLGINSDDVADVTDAFEAGERMILSFDKDVQINRFDFNRLGSDETFSILVGSMSELVIAYDDLTHKGSGYFDTNWVVTAGTTMEFYTTGASVVGLDGIDVTLLGASSPLTLKMTITNGTPAVVASFSGVPENSHRLQYRAGLTDSNGWTTVSAPFSADTIWPVADTNHIGFYRTIAE